MAGRSEPPYGIWGVARDVALQADGRIVAVGTNGAGLAVARYLPKGSLDPTFGKGGKVGDAFDMMWADAVAIQADGKIVAGGDLDIFRMALARLTPDGTLDPTFSGDGKRTWSVAGVEQGVTGLVIEPGGRIVAGGAAGPHEYGDDAVWRFYVTRLRSNGASDEGFGGGGIVATAFPGGGFAAGMARQPDGRVVMVGGVGDYLAGGFGVARYLA